MSSNSDSNPNDDDVPNNNPLANSVNNNNNNNNNNSNEHSNPPPKQPPNPTTLLVDIISGFVSSAISKSLPAPIERVRVLLQTQPELLKADVIERPFKGVLNCLLRIFFEEGILGLFRGNLVNVVRTLPTQLLNFALKDKLKRLTLFEKKTYWNTFLSNIISGVLAGSSSLLFVYPLDSARIILMSDVKKNGEHQFRGVLDVFKKVLRKRGIEGLYQGFMVSILGILVYRAVYFGFYDFLRKFIKNLENRQKIIVSFLIGFSATIVAGLVVYPLDTIRTRMIVSCVFGKGYKTSFHALRDILLKEGFSSLFRGVKIRTFSSIFAAIILAVYDVITKK